MAQLQHLSRRLATVPMHLNRIFIELFIEMNNCLYCCMHSVMMFCNKAGVYPSMLCSLKGPAAVEFIKRNKIPAMGIVAYYSYMLCWSANLK